MLHARIHPTLDVPGCFGCRVASVSFAPSAMPSRHAQAVEANEREARWNRDLPAYKRLVESGLQPRQIDGAHRLEATATERHQIEGGIDPKIVERVMG
jgi:hypothetical protein